MSSRGRLSTTQVEQLLQPIKPGRVFEAQGQHHVAVWDVTAHLSRMFGFGGWEKEILELELISERVIYDEKKKRDGFYVTYLCRMRLRIFDPHGRLVVEIDDAATGTAQNLPSPGDAHDFAVKNAVSYALKRCAKDLGDQFGLSLYNKGQTGAVVVKTLVSGWAHPHDSQGAGTEPQVEGE